MKAVWTALAALLATAAYAQPRQRTLDVPATAGWKHAETDMILPPAPLGMTRSWLRDATSDELDVSAEYKDAAAGLIATVYIYKTTLADAPLWFDRSLETVRNLPNWKLGASPRPAVTAFAPPGQAVSTGLITGFDVDALGQRGSAIAVAPLGSWLVKVRMSSTRLDGAATQERLRAFVSALRWPKRDGKLVAAVPIEACAAPLQLRRAKVVKPDMTQSLLSGLLGAISTRPQPTPTAVAYCREPGSNVRFGVYRPNASASSYILALGDAGVALSLQPAMNLDDLQRGKSGTPRGWSMSLLERNSVGVMPMFNRLPPPEQAYDVASKASPSMSMGLKDKPD